MHLYGFGNPHRRKRAGEEWTDNTIAEAGSFQEGQKMTVDEAREIGRAWVEEEGRRQPGFRGAHLSGSITLQPREAEFAAFSDIDLYCLTDAESPPGQEKIRYRGVLLETVWEAAAGYQVPETILSDPFKAHMLLPDCILSDPAGILTSLQSAVRAEYSKAKWLRARCSALKVRLEELAGEMDRVSEPRVAFAMIIRCIAFQAALVAVARLRPPTVRRGLALAKSILGETGGAAVHLGLLEVLGCAGWSREQVEASLRECAGAFDRAVEVRRSPCGAAFNLNPAVRPYLIEGSHETIEGGDHREAEYWIARMRLTAEGALRNDLPEEEKPEWAGRYDRFLASLGLRDADDTRDRVQRVREVIQETIRWADRQKFE